MKKTFLCSVFALIAATSFISCGSDEVVSVTTDWIENELQDLENCGYFFTTNEIGQLDMIEGEFKKATGYEKSAYGFIFGYPYSLDGKVSNYIRFEINTDGEYALYKVEGSKYTDLIEANDKNTAYFYESDAIVKGYDSVNKLKVELVNDKYTVYINGTKIKSDILRIKNSLYGAMAFFSVGSEKQEKLPDEVVKVTYRITDGTIHKLTDAEMNAINSIKAKVSRTSAPEK